MSRIVETYGDLSCGEIDEVPSKKKGEKFVYMNIHYYVTNHSCLNELLNWKIVIKGFLTQLSDCCLL
jgi:hypothetical protein